MQLPIRRLSAPFNNLRIVHLSDLHMRPRWDRALDQIIDRLHRRPPDLIVMTGDFVEDKHDPRPALRYVERFFTQLRSRLGVVAVLGNHDGQLSGAHLARWGVRLLGYEPLRLEIPSAGDSRILDLIGLEGVFRHNLPIDRLEKIPPRPAGALRIVLSHYPDAIVRCAHLQADLFLAGHTHGGQICLPGGIPIFTHDSLPRQYCRGTNRYGDGWLVVNRGLGFTGIPMRLFCPAEVIEIKVMSTED